MKLAPCSRAPIVLVRLPSVFLRRHGVSASASGSGSLCQIRSLGFQETKDCKESSLNHFVRSAQSIKAIKVIKQKITQFRPLQTKRVSNDTTMPIGMPIGMDKMNLTFEFI